MSFRVMPNSSLDVWRDVVGKFGQMPELDIVAVHGLNPTSKSDHDESTWTCEDGTCWLVHRNFLPKKLPQARILRYRYNSAIFCSGSTIIDQARDLVQRLHTKRSGVHGDPRRPLVFIAHSLGGLLVKAALVAAIKVEGDIYRDLATCPKGLATFGTPHRGSIFATLSGVITDFFDSLDKLDKLMGDQPTLPEGYRGLLRHGDGVSYIMGVQFSDCYKTAIPITSFYEMKGFFLGVKLVTKKSATLKDNRREPNHRERRVGLNANHSNMVKLSHADRGIGRDVLVEIKRLADKVLESGSTSGLASESTETSTDGGALGPSESTAASWEEGSVTYSGDDGVDTEMGEDEFIDSRDDGIDTEMQDDEIIDFSHDGVDAEMWEDEFINESNFSSTSDPSRGTVSSSGPKVRQRDPSDTHAMPESAPRPNIGHIQWGHRTTPRPPVFCPDCLFSNNHQCPSHCKYCHEKRNNRFLQPGQPSNNKNRQSFNGLPKYWDGAELCQRHQEQWKKPRDQPGRQKIFKTARPEAFLETLKQPRDGPVHSSASQHKPQMPAANATQASGNPQNSSPFASMVSNSLRRRYPSLSAPLYSQEEEEEEEKKKAKEKRAKKGRAKEERARPSGREKKVRKLHQDHSEPSGAHTPQWESGTPAQGSRKSQRINKDRRDPSPKQPPPIAVRATTSTKTRAKPSENTPTSNASKFKPDMSRMSDYVNTRSPGFRSPASGPAVSAPFPDSSSSSRSINNLHPGSSALKDDSLRIPTGITAQNVSGIPPGGVHTSSNNPLSQMHHGSRSGSSALRNALPGFPAGFPERNVSRPSSQGVHTISNNPQSPMQRGNGNQPAQKNLGRGPRQRIPG